MGRALTFNELVTVAGFGLGFFFPLNLSLKGRSKNGSRLYRRSWQAVLLSVLYIREGWIFAVQTLVLRYSIPFHSLYFWQVDK